MIAFLSRTNLLYWIARTLLVGVFVYFGIESIFHPETFSFLVPDFVDSILRPELLVTIHGGIEVCCGLLILFKLGKWFPYALLFISFLGVVFTVSGTTLVRDIGILAGLLFLIHIDLFKIPEAKAVSEGLS